MTYDIRSSKQSDIQSDKPSCKDIDKILIDGNVGFGDLFSGRRERNFKIYISFQTFLFTSYTSLVILKLLKK